MNFLGTPEEIWKHSQELGYKGRTSNLEGFPVPDGGDIIIEAAESRKPGGIRLRNRTWHKIDELQTGKGRLKSQSSIIEYGISALEVSLKYGPVYATTPDGIQKYDNMIEILSMKPYFDAVGFKPVIAFDKKDLPNN